MRLTLAQVSRKKKRPFGKPIFSHKRMLSATMYIRHTSESLRSASSPRYIRTLCFHRERSSSHLLSLSLSLSLSDLFAHRRWHRARENPTHTLSALTLARGRILTVIPTKEAEEISS